MKALLFLFTALALAPGIRAVDASAEKILVVTNYGGYRSFVNLGTGLTFWRRTDLNWTFITTAIPLRGRQ